MDIKKATIEINEILIRLEMATGCIASEIRLVRVSEDCLDDEHDMLIKTAFIELEPKSRNDEIGK